MLVGRCQKMQLILSAILFSVFALNVIAGSMGGTVYLGDVQEMLVLFAAAIAFVAAILKREAAAKNQKK